MNLTIESFINLGSMVVVITAYIVTTKVTQKSLQEKIDDIKENIKEFKNDIKDHIKNLEEKQNKHNNLIERMVVVEQSTKSAHKRLDNITDKSA